MSDPTAKELLAWALKAKGLNGLYNEAGECNCDIDCLMPCESDCSECRGTLLTDEQEPPTD